MFATATMQQLTFDFPDKARAEADARPAAPPMSIVRRAIARALEVMHLLDRTDPGLSRLMRKQILSDAGAALTPGERARFGNLFRAQLFQRQMLQLFWIPSERHITTRRTYELKERRRTLPMGAILIGTYEFPCPESQFLDDLDELLANIRQGAAL